MGILDKVGALLPWRSERREPQPALAESLALREDLDRWLQRLMDGPPDSRTLGGPAWMPSVDVTEADDKLIVTVEVPGLERDDLDLGITPEGLIIRGEKREEREDTRKDYRLLERRYGGFVRTVPLPPGLALERAEARVKRGVLTVTIPKAPERTGTRHIPIKT
jgi:HSP20 family protein